MCGIVGIVGFSPVDQRIYDALTVLQHRGQDAAGIMTAHEGGLFLRKDNGLVRDVFLRRVRLGGGERFGGQDRALASPQPRSVCAVVATGCEETPLTLRDACLVFAVAVGLYLPTARYGFVQDDRGIVALNPAAHSLPAALRAVDDPYWPPPSEAGLWRPLTILSFAVDWTVAGGHPGWLHVANALWHGLAAVLLFAVCTRWLPTRAAAAAALVFAAHPVHVEAVAGLVGRARVLPAPVGGKTGTTNDFTDAWFIGFTPSLTVGVWVGLDQKKTLGEEQTGSETASPIFVRFMEQYLAKYPKTGKFRPPSGVYMIEIDKYTGKLVTPDCLYPLSEAFLPGTEPLEFCNEEEHQKIYNYFKTEAESSDD